MKRRREDRPDGELAELAALADGSLAPERRAELDARVAASSELAERLGEQLRAVALAQRATNGVEAPAALRAHIDAQRRARRSRRPRRLVLVGAAATAAVAVAVGVVVFGSGTSSERFQAALAATDLQPGARGDATLIKTASGWRIELNATGLPRLADGQGACRIPVGEAGDVDGDKDVPEIARERGDRSVELAGLERGLRLERLPILNEVQLLG